MFALLVTHLLMVFFFILMQERFYFGDHVLPLFETGIPLLKKRLQQLADANNVSEQHYYILSP